MDTVGMESLLRAREEKLRGELRADDLIEKNRSRSVERLREAYGDMLLRYNAEHFTGGRKNWDEFLDASEELYAILQHVSGVPETGLTMEQRDKLSECFKGFQSENIDRRYGFWIDRIRENYFDFKDFDDGDRNVEYSIGLILSDMNWRKQFYDEINDHFFWVKQQLEDSGIDRLGKKYKGY